MDNWNPLTDTVPIHSWIHPWLLLLQGRLEPLYPPIRSKLANALQRWHPSDTSARLILQPWKDVFTPGAWEAFMVKNIIPKLGMYFFSDIQCMKCIVFHPCPFGFSSCDISMFLLQPCVWKNWLSTLTSSKWSHLIGWWTGRECCPPPALCPCWTKTSFQSGYKSVATLSFLSLCYEYGHASMLTLKFSYFCVTRSCVCGWIALTMTKSSNGTWAGKVCLAISCFHKWWLRRSLMRLWTSWTVQCLLAGVSIAPYLSKETIIPVSVFQMYTDIKMWRIHSFSLHSQVDIFNLERGRISPI